VQNDFDFPLSANTASSIFSASQKVDHTGAVLGLGNAHIMSAGHLESRDATFHHLHSNIVKLVHVIHMIFPLFQVHPVNFFFYDLQKRSTIITHLNAVFK
jgi:hypothetical protein